MITGLPHRCMYVRPVPLSGRFPVCRGQIKELGAVPLVGILRRASLIDRSFLGLSDPSELRIGLHR